ncbi:MAG: transcriptional regulator [Candidatus Fischerbacteria bacterium RBG_13_37_8]|uniref:Probable transcriptional regulatory protein A2Y62_07330 n=1 Tax=Candidatus Fischerbacteria bacterium RBG_13_37_8 TaxID=1817863 RepID=A0A1F5VJC0_9BACT|nr:MAG: transcriptional regulator [Candidatus Fischerbacteria bacterium RBG_13_37_8]
MSGHSKWANIKHRKSQQDAKKGKAYTKVIKELSVAAKSGTDPEANPRLRMAIQAARGVNMPSDTIKRAIAKGSGQYDDGSRIEEILYEGYGAGGIAVLVEAITDNKNRTVGELRHVFARHGGNLAEAGCVAWMFSKKGFVQVLKANIEEDALLGLILDVGVDDVTSGDNSWEIYCAPSLLEQILKLLKDNSIEVESSELAMLPQSYIAVAGKQAQQVLSLVEALEDHEDVETVWTNLDIPDEELQKLVS